MSTATRQRTMFVVPLHSPMDAADAHRLGGMLGMTTHFDHPPTARPTSPGVARMDSSSGVFLVAGDEPGAWRLEGRTWGTPSAAAVHRWHMSAADAARRLDPEVPVPERLASS